MSRFRCSFLLLFTFAACGGRLSDGGDRERTDGANLPTPVCDVKAAAFGAVGNGTTVDTAAVQKAIDSCAGTGGSVYLHDGHFLSGTIKLGSDMTFYIDSTASLLGIRGTGAAVDPSYPDLTPATNNSNNAHKVFVYAQGATNLTIAGPGAIDGNSDKTYAPWGPGHNETTRPIPLYLAQCNNVTIRDITIKNGAMWNLVPLETDNLTISNVTVNSTDPENRDGIDICDCHHVRIDRLSITSDDDAICLKSGSSRGIDDLVITNSVVHQSVRASGIKFGTVSGGSLTNATFKNIAIHSVANAAIALESVDGAKVENVTYDSITFDDVGSPFFIILGNRHRIGSLNGVTFKNITGQNVRHDWASPISGTIIGSTTYKLTNVTFDHVNIVADGGRILPTGDPPEYVGQYPEISMWGDMPAYGYFLRHMDGVLFNSCNTSASSWDIRNAIEMRDVANLTTLPAGDWARMPLVDFNGDGYADFADHDRLGGVFFVHLNQKNGISFTPQGHDDGESGTNRKGSYQVLLGDFNHDGWADYADHDRASGQLYLHLNQRTTPISFTPQGKDDGQATTASSGNWQTLVADFNGDGYADYADHDVNTGRMFIHLNQRTSPISFTPQGRDDGQSITGNRRNWEVVLADFNHDGWTDYADHDRVGGSLFIHLNQKTMPISFTPQGKSDGVTTTATAGNFELLLGDFNGDGFADYADHDINSGRFAVHLNQKTSPISFTPQGQDDGQASTAAGVSFEVLGVRH